MRHIERHRSHRIGWLRAAVLGANDGIVSTASLVVGVAAAGAESRTILVTGVAGLVAGAMSMAAGEYVSVSSQSDTEHADLERERKELATEPEHELAELTGAAVGRGLAGAAVGTYLVDLDRIAGLPGRAGCAGRAHGRRLGADLGLAGDLLGRARVGDHRRHRAPVRRQRLGESGLTRADGAACAGA